MRPLLCLLVAAGLLVQSPPVVCSADGAERPKIGLALSGGGARGSAHVGVLRALEQLEVPIDYIAGTSMGAIVGALYAAGYSPDEIEQVIVTTDWVAAFADSPDRPNMTMRKKQLDARFLIPHRVGFNSGKIQFPRGIIEGQRLQQIFQRLFLPVDDVSNFSRLEVPFHAVATDLATGEEVVLSRGALATAVRASMSLPGIFAPVQIGNRLLVDGGMANNLPISVVRDMGADIVIAVDISTPLRTREQLDSVFGVTEQITNFLTRKNVEQQIATLGPEDLLIVPDLQDFSSADFMQGAEIIGRGYDAAIRVQAQLVAMAVPGAAAARTPVTEMPFLIQFVEIDNRSVLNDEIVASRIDVAIGEPLDLARLEAGISDVYALDLFQSVTYELATNEAGETGVIVRAVPRSWGPNYLQFGLEFSDDFAGDSSYTIGAAYTRNALNALGGELEVNFSIGRKDLLLVDFYQPVDRQARWFIETGAYTLREQFTIYPQADDSDRALAQLDLTHAGVLAGFGRNFSSTDLVRLDYGFARGDADLLIGEVPLADDDIEVGELELRYQHDSLDSLWFPTEGNLVNTGFRYARDWLGASLDFERAEFSGTTARRFGRNSVLAHLELDYSFQDEVPVERWSQIGGFGRLSGYAPDQFAGPYLGLATLSFLRRLNEIDVFPAYLGVALETGNVWLTEDAVGFDDLRYAGSLFIGAETPIGPVYLALGANDDGDSAVYFYLGNPWLKRSQ